MYGAVSGSKTNSLCVHMCACVCASMCVYYWHGTSRVEEWSWSWLRSLRDHLSAPGRDSKLPHFCTSVFAETISLPSPRHVDDTNRSQRRDGEVLFFSRWRGLTSYLHLSAAGDHIVWARAWAFSHVDGLSARFKAPEICLGDKLPAQRGTTADRAFKAVQLDWRASVCLPTAWLLNPAFLLLTICPKSSQG